MKKRKNVLKRIFQIRMEKDIEGLNVNIHLCFFGKSIVVWKWDVIGGLIN